MNQIHAQFVVDDQGNKQSVLIPYSEFIELMEDLHD